MRDRTAITTAVTNATLSHALIFTIRPSLFEFGLATGREKATGRRHLRPLPGRAQPLSRKLAPAASGPSSDALAYLGLQIAVNIFFGDFRDTREDREGGLRHVAGNENGVLRELGKFFCFGSHDLFQIFDIGGLLLLGNHAGIGLCG